MNIVQTTSSDCHAHYQLCDQIPKAKISLKRLLNGSIHVDSGASKTAYFTVFQDLFTEMLTGVIMD